MSQRYFVETPVTTEHVVLAGPEAHHLLNVMRMREGDEVVLFDGSGCEFTARIERAARREVELAVVRREPIDRELPLVIHLGVALPKGDRQAWLVEKAVELGVSRLTPLVTQRSVAQPVENALARLRRGVIEASKQCGRNRLMEVGPPQALDEFVGEVSTVEHLCLLAHPGGRALADLPASDNRPSEVRLAIGPEGGFTDAEVALARQVGWHIVGLGPSTLRVETAALMLSAAMALRFASAGGSPE